MKNRISEWLKHSPIARNTVLKLVSLIFAILLWVYVMDVENPEMLKLIKNVDVKVTGTEKLQTEGLVLLDTAIPSIDVTVKGRRSEVNNVDRSDIRLTMDVSTLAQGEHVVRVDRAVNLDNIVITGLSKQALTVNVDKFAEQLKPVEIAFRGEAKEGFITEAAVPDPPMVLISGPETVVNNVVKLRGDVDSTSITAMTEAQIPIRAVDAAGNSVEGVSLASKSVKANLSLFMTKPLSVNPVLVGNAAEGYELVDVQIDPATVVLKGEEEKVANFSYLKTKPIELAGMNKTETLNVELDLPEGITAMNLEAPLKVLVKIEAVKTRELSYDPEELQFINVAAGSSAKLTGPLKLKIKGTETVIDGLKKDDIKIKIDLGDQGSGTINANVIYETAVKLEGVKIEPGKVEVEIVQ